MGEMAAHTHDDVDWAARLSGMRRLDELESAAVADVADRLTRNLDAGATVVDVGSGAGGMTTALAASLRARGGGTVVAVDTVDELLTAACHAARESGGDTVTVLDHIGGLAERADDRMDAEDRDTVTRLLDPGADDYLGRRDDIHLLSARTVYLGTKP